MADLKDYSGEFVPNLRLRDFSKDALVRLVEAASKDYIGIDGLWLATVRKRYGDEVAFSCSKEVWETGTLHEIQRGTKAMNISGDDIATLFKYFQIDPGFGAMFTIKCELIRPDLGLVTVINCNVLNYAERHKAPELQKLGCEELDVPLFQKTADFFNPKIKVKPLKLPPRKSRDDIACQWEFSM